MSRKALNAYLSSLKYIFDWSVTPKTLVIVDNAGFDELVTWHNRYK